MARADLFKSTRFSPNVRTCQYVSANLSVLLSKHVSTGQRTSRYNFATHHAAVPEKRNIRRPTHGQCPFFSVGFDVVELVLIEHDRIQGAFEFLTMVAAGQHASDRRSADFLSGGCAFGRGSQPEAADSTQLDDVRR